MTDHADAIKRIASDVRDIMKSPIDGIFYQHNMENIMNGTAIIFCNAELDNPYCGCPMLFNITFPSSYPHRPPKVKFGTLYADASNPICTMRLHPNFYVEGKVCLSMLNTWHIGDKWSSCQTIRALLITLQSLMTKESYGYEPGKSGTSEDGILYDCMVDLACKNIISHNMYMLLGRYENKSLTEEDRFKINFWKNNENVIKEASDIERYKLLGNPSSEHLVEFGPYRSVIKNNCFYIHNKLKESFEKIKQIEID